MARVRSLWSAAIVALGLAACGRTELEVPEDIPVPDASDVVDADGPDVPDVVCRTNRDCDDRVFCNGTEQCVAGACRPGIPVACDDGIVCTRDQCNEMTGACDSTPDDSRCIAPARCDVRRGCTAAPCAGDMDCDDGNVCNGRETCAAGACQPGPALVCDDGVACTQDACDPRVGCTAVPDNARCDDGVFCNGSEVCSLAVRGCSGGVPVRCDDANPCTTDACDERSRACIVTGRTDDDRDGFPPVRCPGGTDCDDTNPTVNPGAAEVCLDGRDNNCNGRLDCAEPSCAMQPVCAACTPTGPEGPPGTCRDGRDNDCNRLADCADPACARSPECGCVPSGPENNPIACRDGRDNDCDGQLDCADPECAAVPGCAMCIPTGPEGPAGTCNDGRDNDCSGTSDCADRACAMSAECVPTNDNCATARFISLPGSASGTTVGARDDFTPTCSSSMGAPDVVYVFRNPTRQTITIDTIGSAYDTILLVRRDNCMGPDQACDDDAGGGTASRIVLTNAEPGTYFVIVDGFNSGAGAYRLNLTLGSREVCNNAVDDDGDGLADCADTDCAGFPTCMMCTPIARAETGFCTGGRDEDCDGLTDCVDPDCRVDPSCTMCIPTGPENNPTACMDGRDNDCDRALDCADTDCRGVPGCTCVPTGPENNAMACVDGRDNDCDGRLDCADTECAALPACGACVPTGPENNATACVDGRDNDCDRQFDCADTDCASQLACCRPTGAENSPAACGDGVDNDCDGRRDCADADCNGIGMCACVVSGPEVCNDGRDQDCDRLVDCLDPDCAMNPVCTMCVPTGAEAGDVACADGRDNDCDRLFDCADSNCASAFVCCRATGPENSDAACSDGVDNDCDRAVDCLDPGCSMTAPCSTAPRNDTCAGAQTVGVPSVTMGTTVGARNDFTPVIMGFPGCAGGSGPDVVYTFTVRARTPVTIDLTGTGFDPVLFVRRAPCETGAQSACNDDTGGINSRVSFVADPGQYFVFVDGFNAGSQGAFRLAITTGLPAEDCGNLRDDDADGLTDCADTDCSMDPRCTMCVPTGPENNAMACADGRDNDCDMVVDCADADCAAQPMCCRPTGPESGALACTDGRDNDCDRLLDCADPDCAAEPTCCRPTGPENSALTCGDGRDNDCNRLVDCADPGCRTQPTCCRPTGREAGRAACTDGVDNDCDGTLDCMDSECTPFRAFGSTECCNGRDDDGNSVVDEFACACSTNPDCAGVGAGGPVTSPACYTTLPVMASPVCGPDCRLIGGNAFCTMFVPGTTCNGATGVCTR